MSLLRALVLSVPVLIAAHSVLCEVALAASARVTFVLFSDIYQMSGQRLPDGRIRGGFARLAAVVKAERAKGNTVIVAHAGDTLSPSLMSGIDQGAHIVALTNLIAPDIFVPGNHEFDFGKATFLKRMGEAKFPLFAANLRGASGELLAGFKDRKILNAGPVRIGITGATFDETPRASNSEDLRFASSMDTLREQAAELRHEGADFVVAVVHAGRGQDLALKTTGAFDLILSGHDHDLFLNYDEGTAVAESTYDAQHVVIVDAVIEVTERDSKRSVTWSPQFRIVDTATVPPDPEMERAIARYEDAVSQMMDAPLAVSAVALDSRSATVRTREAAIGNLVADAMKTSANADIAITNGGGIRAGRIYAPGTTITRRTILEELPFNNRIVTVEIQGKELKRAIEVGLRRLPEAAGGFPQVSGLAVVADLAQPPGSRVISISVAGKPLDDDHLYIVATNDFLARGGDGYDMFRTGKHRLDPADSLPLANAVMDYLRQIETIRSSVEGRVVFK